MVNNYDYFPIIGNINFSGPSRLTLACFGCSSASDSSLTIPESIRGPKNSVLGGVELLELVLVV